MRRILPCAVIGLALLGLAMAQVADTPRTESPQDFVYKASAAGLAEVNLSMIGATNAGDGDVKKFAERMVDDHGKSNKELLALADKKRLSAAPRMDAEHDQMAGALARLKGSAFDREYMAGMVKDHREAVALFERQSKDGKDEDLKSWAEKTLPTLREHLKMAQDIHGRVKDTGGRDDKDRPKDVKDDKDRVKDRVKDAVKDVKDDKDRPKDGPKDTSKDTKDAVKDRTTKDTKDLPVKDRDTKDRKDEKTNKDDKERPVEKDRSR